MVTSTLPELKSLRGAVSTPEFLIFKDKVKGCEFLGIRDGTGGGRSAVCEEPWGALGSLLNRL